MTVNAAVRQEAVEPGAKFVKVKFDSLAKPVKVRLSGPPAHRAKPLLSRSFHYSAFIRRSQSV